MKKILFASAAALAFATSASAQGTVTVAVGQEGRGYEAFGKQIVERLGTRMPATIANYEGSDDISRAVCDGAADIGIMQIDAIYTRQKEGCRLRVVGTYGEEFAYLLVPANGKYGALSDFDSNARVLVDTIGSGTDLFWHTINTIETGEHGNTSSWSKAQAINDPIFIADTMAELGEIDAVLMVTTPSSVELKGLIDAGWELVDLYDKDINDEVFNGDSLYPAQDAEVAGTGGFFSGNADANSYVVRSFVVVSDAIAKDRRAFADVALAVKAVAVAR